MWNLLWAIPATAAIAVLWAVSAIGNYEYGLTQGTFEPFQLWFITTSAAQMNGYANLAVDALKAILPAMAVVAWIMRRRLAAVGAGLFFLLCLAWSSQNAIGYILTNHSRAVDGRGEVSDRWGALANSLKEAQGERDMVPVHRPLNVVRADLASKRADGRFQSAEGCQGEPRGFVNFCRDYRGLLSEEAAAISAEQLDAKLDDLRGKLGQQKRLTDVDPLASMAASTLAWKRESVIGGRSLVWASIVELMSAFGLALVWGIFAAAILDGRKRQAARLIELMSAEAKEAEPAPEAPAPALPGPEAVRAALTPTPKHTPPSTPPGTRRTVAKKVESTDAVAYTAGEGVLPFKKNVTAIAPAAFFEEQAPPVKLRRKAADREKRPLGGARKWMLECTEQVSGAHGSMAAAWESYLSWCAICQYKNMARGKFERAIAAQVGTVTYGGARCYKGLVIVDDVDLRAAVA